MLDDLLVGAVLIAWTASVHGVFMVMGQRLFRRRAARLASHFDRATMITGIVLWFFLAIVVEAWSWAVVYMALGIFDEMEPALYFSTVSFTTLGFGDIILDQDWRLLGAFQAAAGMMIFGWTTAMVFDAVQRIYGAHQR
ncbi:MAG: potassium channel family protein [Rhodospirillales bacterium]